MKSSLKQTFSTFLLTILTVAAILSPVQAFAIKGSDENSNVTGTEHYIKNDSNTPGAACGNQTSALTGSDNVEKIYNFLIGKGLKDYMAAGILGNFKQESGGTIDPLASDGVAIGIAQWQGSRRTALIKYAAEHHRPLSDLAMQLDYLWEELNSSEQGALTALKATHDVTSATIAFEKNYERCGNCIESNRIKYAGEVLTQYGGGGAGGDVGAIGSGTPAAQCDTGGVTAGDEIKTAIGLAWPTPTGHNLFEPTPAFKKASLYSSDYTDCGAFVATVMVKSGADPDYPHLGTGVQLAYVTSHPAKYTVYNNITDENKLVPGDILVVNNGSVGHTEIFIGANGGKYPIAEASLGGHTPMLNTKGDLLWMLSQSGLVVARPK
jgi:hypothetical protein